MTDQTASPAPVEPEPTTAEPTVAQTVEPATGVPTSDAEEPDGAAEPDAESAPNGPSTGEAWNDVVIAIGDLGDAIAAWARASTNDPENRRHLDEVRSSVNDMAQKADATMASVANSDFGQQVRQGADDAGQAFADTAQKVSEAAAPHVASAFAGLADVFGRAAQKAGEAARQPTAEPPTRPAPEPPVAESASEPTTESGHPAEPESPAPAAEEDAPAE